MLEHERQLIENYMVKECADEWHIKANGNTLEAYYTDILRFTVTIDDGNWYINGDDISLSIAYNIAMLLGETY